MSESVFRRWTPEEVEILVNNYGKIPRRELSKMFIGRTAISLTKKACKLNLVAKECRSVQEREDAKTVSRVKTYRKARNKDIRNSMLADAKRRAIAKNLPFNLTKEDIQIPEICPIFGIKLAPSIGLPTHNSPSLDRKYPDLGYVKSNIWVISHKANRLKNNASLEDLRILVSQLESILR